MNRIGRGHIEVEQGVSLHGRLHNGIRQAIGAVAVSSAQVESQSQAWASPCPVNHHTGDLDLLGLP